MNHFIVDGRYKDILEYHGIDAGEVLKKSRLPGDILNHRTIMMKEEQYYRFLDSIESVGHVTGLAVSLATTDKIEQFSPPIFASFCSKNAKMCIERLARYKKLIGPMRMEISENDEIYGVSFLPGNPEYKLSRFFVESEISFLVNIIRRATKENIKPLRITTTMDLKDSSLEDFTGVKAERGEKTRLYFTSQIWIFHL